MTTPKHSPYDPLLYETPLPIRRTLYPIGFPATIVSNHENVIRAAESIWGKFELASDAPPVELRIAVSESMEPSAPSRMPTGQGHLVSFLHDANNFVQMDLRAGFAYGWLSAAVARDAPYVRYYFVEPAVALMVEAHHLATLHCACVSLDGKGVLLCGGPEAGKSTLAYACARRGWNYVSDDASHVIRNSAGREIFGNPYQVRFRPHCQTLFPELARFAPYDRPNGKPSLELDTSILNISTARSAPADVAVFLNRSGGGQGLTAFDKSEAYQQLIRFLVVGEESIREQQRAAIRRVLDVPVYEMRYQDLDWAEQRLRALVENGR